jgi:biopolymer transport protein ExbD
MGATRHGFRDRSARAMHEAHYGPNMTPMVDVVMVILIFFMASAAILGPEWFIKSSLPVMAAAPATNQSPPTRLTVEVDVTGYALRIDQQPPQPVLEADLVKVLATAKASAKGECIAIVKPTPKAPYEKVILAQEACVRAGLPKSGLAMPGT